MVWKLVSTNPWEVVRKFHGDHKAFFHFFCAKNLSTDHYFNTSLFAFQIGDFKNMPLITNNVVITQVATVVV